METAASLRASVSELFEERTRDKAFARLKAAGERAVPVLLEALDDLRSDDSTWGNLLDLLEPHLSPGMVPRLVALLESHEVSLRERVARMLGRIGSDEAADSIFTVLAEDHFSVRDSALVGIRDGLDEKRQTPAFLARVFDAIAAPVDTTYEDLQVEPADCLLRVDRDRAIPFLLDAARFSAENPRLFEILEALNEAGAPVPPEKLIPVLDELRPEWDFFPTDCAYGEGLKALARARHPDAELRIDEGDFAEYFLGPSGDHAGETPAALRAIGAVEAAEILETALALFGRAGPSRDRRRRKEEVERILDADEEAFPSMGLGDEPIGILLDRYVRANERDFGATAGKPEKGP
ncbi:MAG: DUF4375 domain-containing protein [Planctomycetes bacterium]|nr:DUF4375 domain-containing protein [Planctomycetota bacterium]